MIYYNVLNCNITEPRLAQTPRCMKQMDEKLSFKRNIDAKTGDLDKHLKIQHTGET